VEDLVPKRAHRKAIIKHKPPKNNKVIAPSDGRPPV